MKTFSELLSEKKMNHITLIYSSLESSELSEGLSNSLIMSNNFFSMHLHS